MSDVDTFGITLPVRDWQALFVLAQEEDRAPSDVLRRLIRDAARTRGVPLEKEARHAAEHP